MSDAIDLRERCALCGHAFSFHGKALGIPCRAMGCRGGPDDTRCPGFVRTEAAVSLSASA